MRKKISITANNEVEQKKVKLNFLLHLVLIDVCVQRTPVAYPEDILNLTTHCLLHLKFILVHSDDLKELGQLSESKL